jgi:hypothetical protein
MAIGESTLEDICSPLANDLDETGRRALTPLSVRHALAAHLSERSHRADASTHQQSNRRLAAANATRRTQAHLFESLARG